MPYRNLLSKRNNSEEPKKDNVSEHTMDAFRYFFVNYFGTDNLTSIKTNSQKSKKSQRWESLTIFSQGLVSFSHTMTPNSHTMKPFSHNNEIKKSPR